MPKPFIKIVWFMLNICFSPGSLEFWYMLHRACLHDQDSQRPWLLSLRSHPAHSISHMLLLLLEILLSSLWLHYESTLGNVSLVSSTLPHVPFFIFVVFASYPFTVINLSHEYEYILNYVSPSELPSLGVVVGTPNTVLEDLKWKMLFLASFLYLSQS